MCSDATRPTESARGLQRERAVEVLGVDLSQPLAVPVIAAPGG
jgi:hypothetical protein